MTLHDTFDHERCTVSRCSELAFDLPREKKKDLNHKVTSPAVSTILKFFR